VLNANEFSFGNCRLCECKMAKTIEGYSSVSPRNDSRGKSNFFNPDETFASNLTNTSNNCIFDVRIRALHYSTWGAPSHMIKIQVEKEG